jgi:hypothetical protein
VIEGGIRGGKEPFLAGFASDGSRSDAGRTSEEEHSCRMKVEQRSKKNLIP